MTRKRYNAVFAAVIMALAIILIASGAPLLSYAEDTETSQEIEGSDSGVGDARIWHTVRMKPGGVYDASDAGKNTTVFIEQEGTFTLKGKSSYVRVVINAGNGDVRVRFADGLNLDCGIYTYAGSRTSPINITDDGGTVTLVSEKNANIYFRGYISAPGIRKEGIKTNLTFETEDPENPGTIKAIGYYTASTAAGIGTVPYFVGRSAITGNVTINSGNVVALGGGGAAGIGGGYNCEAKGITINGGNVKAYGGGGAGIGGGHDSMGSNITINGGVVSAGTSDPSNVFFSLGGAAAIGGGQHHQGKNIVIRGGTVTAISTGWGAAIGGGAGADGVNIGIYGGTVYAMHESPKADEYHMNGAAIGGGGNDGGNGQANGVNIWITGGRVYAGAYDYDAFYKSDSISTAIGGGSSLDDENKHSSIHITGGTIYAVGGDKYNSGTGGGAIGGSKYATTVITGGSFYAANLGATGSIRDEDGNDLHMVDVAFDGVNDAWKPITNLEFSAAGISYGMKDVVTMNTPTDNPGIYEGNVEATDLGRFYPWLPASDTELKGAKFSGVPYYGRIRFDEESGVLYRATSVEIKGAKDSVKSGSAYGIIGKTKLEDVTLPEITKGYKCDWLVLDKDQYVFVSKADGTLLENIHGYTDASGAWAYTESGKAELRVWETPVSYNVHFDPNKPDASSADPSGQMNDQYMVYDKSEKLTENAFALAGYSFDGWNTKADGSGTDYTDQQSVSNLTTESGGIVTLYAQWKPKTYTVTLDSGEASPPKTKELTLTYDQAGTLPAFKTLNWSYEGHAFHGWTVSGKTGAFYGDAADVVNLCTLNSGGDPQGWTLKAIWVPAGSITITATENGQAVSVLNEGGKFRVNDGNADYELITVENPKGTYTVSNTAAIGTGTFSLSMDSDDYVIPAALQQFEYDGTKAVSIILEYCSASIDKDAGIANAYFRAGGTSNPQNLLHIPEGEEREIYADAETGYHFDGYSFVGVEPNWEKDASTAVQKISLKGQTALTAHAEANVYTVKFDANGGSGTMEDQDMVYGEPQDLFANRYSRKGYVFTGWNTKADGSGDKYDDRENVQDLSSEHGAEIKLYAQWDIIVYNISYNLKGGEMPFGTANPVTYTVEDCFTLEEPVADDYSFTGWTGTDLSDPTRNLKIVKGSTGDRSYEANWTIKKFRVNFESNGGSAVASQTVTIHDKASEPSDPSRKGYIFEGWYTDQEFTGVYDFSSEVTADTTLYAKWTAKEYTITYDLNGGTLDGQTGKIKEKSCMDAVIIVKDAPTRKGYKFRYWKGSVLHPGDKYTVSGDHTLSAVWKKSGSGVGTGDENNILPWAVMMILASAGMLILLRKRMR